MSGPKCRHCGHKKWLNYYSKGAQMLIIESHHARALSGPMCRVNGCRCEKFVPVEDQP